MKPWLKGGLMGGGIALFFTILAFVLPMGEFGNLGFLILIVPFLPLIPLVNLFPHNFYPDEGMMYAFIFAFILSFLEGSLLGFIIGIIKSKNISVTTKGFKIGIFLSLIILYSIFCADNRDEIYHNDLVFSWYLFQPYIIAFFIITIFFTFCGWLIQRDKNKQLQ
jgi:hypothetical protein